MLGVSCSQNHTPVIRSGHLQENEKEKENVQGTDNVKP